ncbi:MAG: recombinase family protein [Thermoproteota archaeon]|nr:recombinase family protein [Thermoproteota archaeon]
MSKNEIVPFLYFSKTILTDLKITQLLFCTEMKFAFAYLRVSTDEQTVLNQKIAMQKWAIEHDYQVLEYFEDSAISGRIPAIKRKGFLGMLDIIRNEPVDAVLIYELSRVGRTFWDTLDAIKAIEEYAPLISCSPRESFLQMTEPSVRKLMIGILTWVAEREREMLVQRTRDGITRAKLDGKLIGRPKKEIDKDALIDLLVKNESRSKIAKSLGVSKATLYKELRQLDKNIKK